MKKQLFLLPVIAVILLHSCQSSKVNILGRMVGHSDKEIYLEQASLSKHTIVDSTTLDKNGEYSFTMKDVSSSPLVYNIVYQGERIPLLIAAGDKLTVESVGSIVRNYNISGSKENELLQKFYQPYVIGAQNLNVIAAKYAREGISDTEREKLSKEYVVEYYRIRREQLAFIIENKDYIASVYALYQRLPGDQNLFNGDSDVIYYRTVAEAIQKSYPESSYLTVLNNDIMQMNVKMKLESEMKEVGFPEIEMNDMYGKKQTLSALVGKVVLLDFWSAELGSSNAINADLKDTYAKYKDAKVPFEVYQIAIDNSKTLWINSVQEQALPWISVSDLQGEASTALSLYNIQKLPSNFLIDKGGNIVARNVYGNVLEQRLNSLTK